MSNSIQATTPNSRNRHPTTTNPFVQLFQAKADRQSRNARMSPLILNGIEGEGVIDSVVKPGEVWRVQLHGIFYPARSVRPANFVPGDLVRAVGHDNITVLVDELVSDSV